MIAHKKTTMSYRPTREESEPVVRMLCDRYPKCFFENPRQRLPLKHNVEKDIIADPDFEVDPVLITAAVEFYKNHVGYAYKTIAGSKRIDLNGREVGTVTEQEALAAEQRANEIHAMWKERATVQSPVKVLGGMHDDGRISDDGVKKLDAPQPQLQPRSKATAIAPEFAGLYETLTAANAAVVNISDPTMRTALALASLEVVARKLQQVQIELKGGGQQ